jgi:hypothetical protein
MPGASRTRSLVCEWKKHTSKSPQVSRFAGIPCARENKYPYRIADNRIESPSH